MLKRKKIKIKNIFGEKLDVLIEGNKNSKNVIVFVHGFGTDKDERGLHKELAENLKDTFLILRFDQSACGNSEGEKINYNQFKASGDLSFILKFLNKEYSGKKINIIAHSMGGYIVSLLAPCNISKTIFTGIEKIDNKETFRKIEKFIIERGGVVDTNGISYFPRSDSSKWIISKQFWKILINNNYKELLEYFSKKTNLIIFKPKQDEIIGYDKKDSVEYQNIKTLKYVEVNGDHNFSKPEDRRFLFKKIKGFLEE